MPLKAFDVRLDPAVVSALQAAARRAAFEGGRPVTWVDLLRRGAEMVLAAVEREGPAAILLKDEPGKTSEEKEVSKMPREQFSDEYLAKFNITHKPAPEPDKRQNTAREWAFTSARGFPAKTIGVSFEDWADLVRLSERNGYSFHSNITGLFGEHVRQFAAALRKALSGTTDQRVPKAANRVLDFVEGPAKGGFKMESRWVR